jgi:altronate dehydratase
VKDGWLPDSSATTWVINSIGVISHGGHQLLVAVLSSGQPSEPVGIAQVDEAARAAVSALTGGRT